MPRLVYLSGVGLLLVGLAFVVTDRLLAPPPTPGITEANVRRLRPGMTPDEIEAVLGPRPVLYVSGAFNGATSQRWSGRDLFGRPLGGFGAAEEFSRMPPAAEVLEVVVPPRPCRLVAAGEGGAVVLDLGADERLVRAEWHPDPGAAGPKATRLRAWLGW
jgi:hypothetical protein